MGLREIAEADLAVTLEDTAGFGWPITITDPGGFALQLTGQSDDIAQTIDPDTGLIVSGRRASVAVRLKALYDGGLSIPQGIVDEASRPWLVQFEDINGLPYNFKVVQSNPDRALGLVTLILGAYKLG
jgi:hypothetical protein